jgi:hypothetical protein
MSALAIPPSTRRLIAALAWLLSVHVLLAYGLPGGLFAVLVILLAVVYWRSGPLGAVTVTLTLILITSAYWAALRITGFEDRIYYRPDEKYVRFDYQNSHRRFAPNVRVERDVPHGDLRAMTAEENDEPPRRVAFRTDRDGFRNDRDYHGQRWLLVGDSFVTGHGNSQEDLLVTQLGRDHGIDAYSLGNTGNLSDYLAYVRGFRKRYGDEARVLLFIFEGNDFEPTHARAEHVVRRYWRRYYRMFSGLNTYRVTMSLYKRYLRRHDVYEGGAVMLADVAGRRMMFYRPYVEVAEQRSPPDMAGFDDTLLALGPSIERVYFIPTKYRVYYRQLQPHGSLPNTQWNYLSGLCARLELRCTDLTEPLVRESERLLAQGRFTWWRDDTHWNRHGIAVAARLVAGDLRRGTAEPR